MRAARWIQGLAACAVASVSAAQAQPAAADAATRGRDVFAARCVLCHGAEADGNGRAASLFTPRPSNLRLSDKDDAYLSRIVHQGGAALGRSAAMPAWGGELNEAEINDIVAFLRSVNARR